MSIDHEPGLRSAQGSSGQIVGAVSAMLIGVAAVVGSESFRLTSDKLLTGGIYIKDGYRAVLLFLGIALVLLGIVVLVLALTNANRSARLAVVSLMVVLALLTIVGGGLLAYAYEKKSQQQNQAASAPQITTTDTTTDTTPPASTNGTTTQPSGGATGPPAAASVCHGEQACGGYDNDPRDGPSCGDSATAHLARVRAINLSCTEAKRIAADVAPTTSGADGFSCSETPESASPTYVCTSGSQGVGFDIAP